MSEQQFARSATGDIFGKLDAALPQVRINADTLADMHRAAHEAGMGFSEWVRTQLYVALYGVDHVVSLTEQRLRRVLLNAPQVHNDRSDP